MRERPRAWLMTRNGGGGERRRGERTSPLRCGKYDPLKQSLFDQDSNVTQAQLLNSQIEIARRKLDTPRCKYGDGARSVSGMGRASCPSRWLNSVTHAHPASLSSLTPPLCLICSPLSSLPVHLHTSPLPLAGDFQCIFNDDLAGRDVINCRNGYITVFSGSKIVEGTRAFIFPLVCFGFTFVALFFFTFQTGTHTHAHTLKHAQGAESCRWKSNAFACLVSLPLTLIAPLLWNPAHQVSLLTHLSIPAPGGRV